MLLLRVLLFHAKDAADNKVGKHTTDKVDASTAAAAITAGGRATAGVVSHAAVGFGCMDGITLALRFEGIDLGTHNLLSLTKVLLHQGCFESFKLGNGLLDGQF